MEDLGVVARGCHTFTLILAENSSSKLRFYGKLFNILLVKEVLKNSIFLQMWDCDVLECKKTL